MAAEETKQTTVRLEPDLHRRLKVICARNDSGINDVIISLVEKYVEKQETKFQRTQGA